MFCVVWLSINRCIKDGFLKLPYVFFQQGILSRVTESVKNIVPGWLQRYFNKNEDVCSCSTDTAEVPQWPENRENDHLIYANEESSNIHDGRITPEPTVSNTEGK